MREAIKRKAEQVKALTEESKNYKTLILLDLRQLPDSLLQRLRKKIKEEGDKVKVVRKAVVTRLLQTNQILAQHVDKCDRPVAVIFTNKTPYQIHQFLKQNTKMRAAKVGDVPEKDIVVEAGETDLPPGPALSELKAAGINVQIKGGKIHVIKDSVVVKAGEAVGEKQAKALQTLGVTPFEVKARMVFGFDGQYVFTPEILALGDSVKEDLRREIKNALNLSINAGYPTAQNIKTLLKQALQQSINLSINGGIYSPASIKLLLAKAVREANILDERCKK